MYIGMVCPYSLSVPGGVQGQVFGLARALRSRGHVVQIIAPADGPTTEGGVMVVGQSVMNAANGSVAPISPNAPTQIRTMRMLWDENFDVLHLHEPLVPGPSVTALLLKPAPVVGTFHAAGDQPAYSSFSSLARWVGGRIDAKVAVSEEARRLAGQSIPEPWTVLFNGIEIDQFAGAEPWDRPDEAGDEGKPAVFFLGRHEERKGLGVLLEALSEMDDDVVVWIAGTGPETLALKAKYRDDKRLRWLGRISNEERNRRLVAAAAFVAPSLGGESFGVILLEAMAAGAPVVCSDITGYVGVAGPLDGEPAAARITRTGDSRSLAEGLAEVLRDRSLAEVLREHGRRRANRFSMDRLAEAYTVLYEAVIAEAAMRA